MFPGRDEITSKYPFLVMYDGVCNFCNASVNLIIRHDRNSRFFFLPLQSETGKRLKLEMGISEDSIIYLEKGRVFTKSDAALRIAVRMGGAYRVLFLFMVLPSFVRNALYDYIARHRYRWFGKGDKCIVPAEKVRKKFLEIPEQ